MDEYCGYEVEDVHSGTEMDEVMCETCGTIQPATNKFCTHCGEDLKKEIIKGGSSEDKKKIRSIVLCVVLIVAVVVAMVLSNVFHDLISEEKTVEGEEISIELPEISMPEISLPDISDFTVSEMDVNGVSSNSVDYYPVGEYVVGVDIPAGEYLLCSDDLGDNTPEWFGEAYASLSDDTEEIFGSWFQYSRYAKLEDGQYLDLSWCNAYDVSSHTIENDPFEHPGMFKVGVDVEAGTYEVKAIDENSMHFYYVHDSLEDFDDAAMFDYFRENYGKKTEVTLKEGQYLELFCCVIEEIE